MQNLLLQVERWVLLQDQNILSFLGRACEPVFGRACGSIFFSFGLMFPLVAVLMGSFSIVTSSIAFVGELSEMILVEGVEFEWS